MGKSWPHYVALLLLPLLAQIALAVESVSVPSIKDMMEQEEVERSSPELEEIADKFHRGTPRSAVLGLRQALQAGDYQRAVNYLDMRYLPGGVERHDAPALAHKLRIIAERAVWIDPDTLSIEQTGHTDDGLPMNRDRFTQVETPAGPVDIWLQRVPREDGILIWKISNQTVARIPELYGYFGYGPLGDKLSSMLPEYKLFGLYLWQWVVLIPMMAVCYLIAWIVTLPINLVLRRRNTARSTRQQRFVAGPIRLLIAVLLARALFDDIIDPTLEARAIFDAETVLILVLAWTLMGTVELVLGRLGDHMHRNGQEQGTLLLRPATRGIKVIILLLAIFIWLDNLGFKITTLLAGLGVTSIAIALAAQKPLENLLGAITLYASQPVRVGEFCRFGNKLGTVEEIGLRATLVRTLDRTLLNIPNASFANAQVENFTQRDKILYRSMLRLRIETTPDQIRFVLVEIRELLYAHPMVLPDPARVRFSELGEHSLNLDVFAYVKTNDYGQYLGVAEDLNLRILDIITKSGSRLAVPARTLYVEKGRGIDEARTREAEEQVNAWRAQHSLYLPEFPEEKRAELESSLDYPPQGSPNTPDTRA